MFAVPGLSAVPEWIDWAALPTDRGTTSVVARGAPN